MGTHVKNLSWGMKRLDFILVKPHCLKFGEWINLRWKYRQTLGAIQTLHARLQLEGVGDERGRGRGREEEKYSAYKMDLIFWSIHGIIGVTEKFQMTLGFPVYMAQWNQHPGLGSHPWSKCWVLRELPVIGVCWQEHVRSREGNSRASLPSILYWQSWTSHQLTKKTYLKAPALFLQSRQLRMDLDLRGNKLIIGIEHLCLFSFHERLSDCLMDLKHIFSSFRISFFTN